MGYMDTEITTGKKSTGKERTQFCYNCKHNKVKLKTPKRCIDCFGRNLDHSFFCYVNWEESKDYHKPLKIL